MSPGLRFVLDRVAGWPRRARSYARWAAVRTLSPARVHLETDWGRFVAPRSDHGLLAPVFTEPFETAVVFRVVTAGMTVVDVGANRGWYSVLMARLVGPAGTVIAVEPDARARTQLLENLALNSHCANVTVLDCALGDHAGVARFVSARASELSRLASSESGDAELVEIRTLRDITEACTRVDFVKIDVEGAEEMVVRGLSPDMSPALLVECEAPLQARYGSSPEALVAALGPRYECYALCLTHGRPEPVDSRCTEAFNLLCLPAVSARATIDRVFLDPGGPGEVVRAE